MITVVSGLPRSGTSMMMMMLDAGGMNVFTDGVRKADRFNRQGYWEHEAVKRLINDNSWLKEAENKVIKVVAPLVLHLPNRFDYKVIFVERNLREIIRSQQMVRAKSRSASKAPYPVALEMAFKNYLKQVDAWIKSNSNVKLLRISYNKTLENPIDTAYEVAEFLYRPLDLDAMVDKVMPRLQRVKQKTC